MAVPPLYAQPALWVNDYNAMPREVAGPLYGAGYRIIVVQLQDHGDVNPERVRDWRALGYKVGGAIRPSGEPYYPSGQTWAPNLTATYASAEKSRLGLALMHFNFEAEIKAADAEGPWSSDFCAAWRARRPSLPSFLNTYRGAEGINHAPYIAKNFRLSVQTADANSVWAHPPTEFTKWAVAIGWKKGYVRPTYAVTEVNGQWMDIDNAIPNQLASQCGKGLTAYYADGSNPEYLKELVGKAQAAGVVLLPT